MTARADQSASREISDGARFSPAVLAAGGVGNLLEWYDFGLYGYFAPVLARLFFPSDDPLASLIGAYGSFAAGFAARPIGAAVLGTVGDRVGRRFVLLLSVTLMGAGTTAIALLPTYAAAGIGAPMLLLLVRLFQG
ncbi:MAG: MFS transporter, partial [Methylocella sp.]